MTKKKNYRVLSFVCILTMLLPILVPGSITYASIVQEQQFSQVNSANADV